MPDYYLFLYFEKNDKPLTLRELQDGVRKDFGWVDYRVSQEYCNQFSILMKNDEYLM